jgi:NTP pyrophosphatase (non-canonical NTP hydrolase)
MTNYRLSVLRNWNTKLNTKDQLANAFMGLAGESGEALDLIKKHLFHDHDLDKNKIINELGDIAFYLEIASYLLGTTVEEIEQQNIEKLNKRYPNGFNKEDSINRKV